jgi:hypothetical protein
MFNTESPELTQNTAFQLVTKFSEIGVFRDNFAQEISLATSVGIAHHHTVGPRTEDTREVYARVSGMLPHCVQGLPRLTLSIRKMLLRNKARLAPKVVQFNHIVSLGTLALFGPSQ